MFGLCWPAETECNSDVLFVIAELLQYWLTWMANRLSCKLTPQAEVELVIEPRRLLACNSLAVLVHNMALESVANATNWSYLSCAQHESPSECYQKLTSK